MAKIGAISMAEPNPAKPRIRPATRVTPMAVHRNPSTPTIDDDAGIPGRFFVADAGGDYRETMVVFKDQNGRELRAPQPVMRYLRGVSVID